MTESELTALYPALSQFFGGYFHQDWTPDHASAEDVIDYFLAECGKDEAAKLLKEILQLERASPTEEMLRDSIFTLGSYYDVTADKITFRKWIEYLHKRFLFAPP